MFSYFKGLIFVFVLTFCSFLLSKLDFFKEFSISTLIIAVFVGMFASKFYFKWQIELEKGVNFSAKKLLRLGIILYGFNISLLDIQKVGFTGLILSVIVVVSILCLGIYLGVKWLKMDKDFAVLVSGGSAICGAAAVLALESVLKAKNEKSVIAVASVVIFGLISMLLYPLFYLLGFVPLDHIQEGFYLGLSLHEVANVVAAGSAISGESANFAIIIKMIRVILLVPVLLILPLLFCAKNSKQKLHIPWFALWFLGMIVLHSFVPLNPLVVDFLRMLCVLSLSAAMVALGLQINFKAFARLGKEAFILAFVLFIVLLFGCFALVFSSAKLGLI